MYSTRTKIADIITVWSDTNGHGSNSTTAALIASRLAVGEKGKTDKRKVLMLSTDPGPGDGVQILSPVVQDVKTMDDLILLATAGGLNAPEELDAYTVKVANNLDVMRSTNDFKRISSEPISAYRKIVDMAATMYDYIVIDAAGGMNPLTNMLLRKADLVVVCVSQTIKHLECIKADKVTTTLPVLEDKNCAVVITRYSPLPYLDTKKVCKIISCDDAFTLSEDIDIHKNVCMNSVYGYVSELYGKSGGLLGVIGKHGRNKDSVTARELDALAESIYGLHEAETEEGDEA